MAFERNLFTVYPPETDVYAWTDAVKFSDIRVVILGQDPYYLPNQDHGLAFSVDRGQLIPRSVANIYTELETDVPGFKAPNHGNLRGWASQGVLLLNTCLTIRGTTTHSRHVEHYQWIRFTDAVIRNISNKLSHVVFMLWGRYVETKSGLIDKEKHLVLVAPHPSPLSAPRGFYGCRHFSKANTYLENNNRSRINWGYLP